MRKDDITILGPVGQEEKRWSKNFWRKAFLIYVLIEIFILVSQYIITRSKCSQCVLPPAFYLVNWLQHLLFTGLLWLCLNQFYHLTQWKVVVLNIALFLVHYFLWISFLYGIFHSAQDWLVREATPSRSFASFIYRSWTDIGKYVLKLSAFYALKFYYEYQKAERQRIQLAVINKDIQLNLLKQQLSPHFYFNTLNNLYGLARGNSEKLSVALHQLSNIMQYVIVDCNQPKVLLSQELSFLQSYIALEKLRYEQDTVIEMKVEGDHNRQTILPLLLIQFVENAFKHGMKEKSDKNWMKVILQVQRNELLFRVDNSYYETTTPEGIGINSVKHILNLQYEGKYDMQLRHENNHFSVTLKLNLS
ncbi:MAG: histidine kinase [Bacteroidota bacterium]|nr:histidine kinase [Bacteroidota bacterium]